MAANDAAIMLFWVIFLLSVQGDASPNKAGDRHVSQFKFLEGLLLLRGNVVLFTIRITSGKKGPWRLQSVLRNSDYESARRYGSDPRQGVVLIEFRISGFCRASFKSTYSGQWYCC